jgi:predicted Zn-dependent protease
MRRTVRLSTAAALCALAACSARQRIATETALAEALVSDEQEKQIGLAVRDDLEKKDQVRYLQDPTVTAFVKEISGKILPLAEKDRPGVTWTVAVIDDPKTVNAFATPGGYLYVYSGLLLAADDPAEVAGVLAHEAGHVVARHSARQMVNAMGIEAVTQIALGENAGGTAQLAAALAGKTLLLAHSRSEELEADEFGARYASAAGYDPRGIATFFQKLEAEQGKTPAILTWLSTHPPSAERIQKVDRYIAENHLAGTGGRDPKALAKVKARIRALPPPPAPKAAPAQPTPKA